MKKIVWYCREGFFLFWFLLVCLFIVFTVSKNGFAICIQNSKGGECVEYVRDYFGGSYQSMPGLCQYNSNCGAYNAWAHWDLGYGSGQIPTDNSIMVINQFTGLLTGHMAVVISADKNYDGTYTLNVQESNWDLDELVDCGVRYTFYPDNSEVRRENGDNKYSVLGFIYGSPFSIEVAPTITLSLNKSTFSPNDTLIFYLSIHNPGPERSVDIYFSFTFPSGREYFLANDDWISSPVPHLTSFTFSHNYHLSNYKWFSWTLPNWKQGEYAFKMWFTEPGTSRLIGEMAKVSFAFSHHDLDQQARQDMINRAASDSRFGDYISGTFDKNLNWDTNWELRWMKFNFSGNRVVRIYHATNKSDSSRRYTIFWDPDTDDWTGWKKVK